MSESIMNFINLKNRSMEILKFVYNDQEVEFQPIGLDNVMVNATQMAKIFGKKVDNFTRTESTQLFISECLKNANKRFISVENESDLIDSRQKSGTYMHRILALKFAAWLDPSFELWVYHTIDKLINHYYREHRDAYIEKLSIKAQKEIKKQELLTKYPDAQDYFNLEDLERKAKIKTIKAMKGNYRQLNLNFTDKTPLNQKPKDID